MLELLQKEIFVLSLMKICEKFQPTELHVHSLTHSFDKPLKNVLLAQGRCSCQGPVPRSIITHEIMQIKVTLLAIVS